MIVFIRWVSINFGKLQSCCNSSQKLNKRVSFLLQELMTLFLIFAFITIVSIPTNYLWENWWKEEEAEARLDMRFDQKSAHCSCQNDNDFSTEVVNTWKGSINIIECYFFFSFYCSWRGFVSQFVKLFWCFSAWWRIQHWYPRTCRFVFMLLLQHLDLWGIIKSFIIQCQLYWSTCFLFEVCHGGVFVFYLLHFSL